MRTSYEKSTHIGLSRTGGKKHAVAYFGGAFPYAKRAYCGVRVKETISRLFGKVDKSEVCGNCLKIFEKS